MGIKDWPADDRPREKLLSKGADALSDAELLAIFLRTGVTGKSAVELAQDLLRQFDGLRALLEADQATFCQAKGLGSAKYAQLQAVLAMARRHLEADLKRGDAFSNPASVREYLIRRLRHLPHECFTCLWLDNRHRTLECEELFRGSLAGASVYPREVVKRALALNAAAVIFAHNHPSGVAEPSAADMNLTTRLQEALALVDVRVLDHFIIGDGAAYSFAEHGRI